jgi:hypothetical protein
MPTFFCQGRTEEQVVETVEYFIRQPDLDVGFTGSRQGTTSGQIHALRSILRRLYSSGSFHHGCCVGADTFAHYEAYNMGMPMVYHPPFNRDHMSDLREFPGEWRKPKPYLERNHDIVDETELLIAMPATTEILRSGCWATVRYARKLSRPIAILDPENPGYIIWENLKSSSATNHML